MVEDLLHFIESRRRRLETSRSSCDTRRTSFDTVLKNLGLNETCLGPLTKFLNSSKIGQACRGPRGGTLHRQTHLETHRESTRWVSRPIVRTHDGSQDPSWELTTSLENTRRVSRTIVGTHDESWDPSWKHKISLQTHRKNTWWISCHYELHSKNLMLNYYSKVWRSKNFVQRVNWYFKHVRSNRWSVGLNMFKCKFIVFVGCHSFNLYNILYNIFVFECIWRRNYISVCEILLCREDSREPSRLRRHRLEISLETRLESITTSPR